MSCTPTPQESVTIFVTATPEALQSQVDITPTSTSTNTPTPIRFLSSPIAPTADPTRFEITLRNASQQHVVRTGDTLIGISVFYDVSVGSILDVNDLKNPNHLSVGQVIKVPRLPTKITPDIKLIPDNRLVRGPGSSAFDVQNFISKQPGYIREATDTVKTRLSTWRGRSENLTAAEVVQRVSLEFSVDARLLLALLEYKSGWLSQAEIPAERQTHPLISKENSGTGLYHQLVRAADTLNQGYYGWKFRKWTTLEFSASGQQLLYDSGLNAGTVGLYYFLAQDTSFELWQHDVSMAGLYSTYFSYFGDPFQDVVDPLFPVANTQPEMVFPFAPGETWFFTGGWHGGWGSGSAWGAIDFAPPDAVTRSTLCYTSEFPVRAVAPGLIVRSENGVVVLDLDSDGDEATGWTVLYLHIASKDRIPVGTNVSTGDVIGFASCEGGFSTATHLHIVRRYNGEWVPADCFECTGQHQRPSFVMSGWRVIGLQNQEYQGFLERGEVRRAAEQGRSTSVNRMEW